MLARTLRLLSVILWKFATNRTFPDDLRVEGGLWGRWKSANLCATKPVVFCNSSTNIMFLQGYINSSQVRMKSSVKGHVGAAGELAVP